MNKRILSLIILIAVILFLILALNLFGITRQLTFSECEEIGGEAWVVNLYESDICPDCKDFYDCLKNHSNQKNIDEACPQNKNCSKCVGENFPYPDKCPGEKEKLGEISDAATWFLCCK